MKNLFDAKGIVEFIKSKGWPVASGIGEVNIVYIRGCSGFGRPIEMTPDVWSCIRLLITFGESGPEVTFGQKATTVPGEASTKSAAARALGGVAIVQSGFYPKACKLGFHKGNRNHPALVQVGDIKVRRDANMDFKSEGDLESLAHGINHHSTRPGYKSAKIGNWSAGCLVGRDMPQHLKFISLVKASAQLRTRQDAPLDFYILESKELSEFLNNTEQ